MRKFAVLLVFILMWGASLDVVLADGECIYLSELFAAPSEYDANEDGEANSYDEYIEICNKCDKQIDMTGWSIRDAGGVTYNVDQNIAANACVVLWRENTNIQLNNSNESVYLDDNNGATVDEFTYSKAKRDLCWQKINEWNTWIEDTCSVGSASILDVIAVTDISEEMDGNAVVIKGKIIAYSGMIDKYAWAQDESGSIRVRTDADLMNRGYEILGTVKSYSTGLVIDVIDYREADISDFVQVVGISELENFIYNEVCIEENITINDGYYIDTIGLYDGFGILEDVIESSGLYKVCGIPVNKYNKIRVYVNKAEKLQESAFPRTSGINIYTYALGLALSFTGFIMVIWSRKTKLKMI